MFSSETTLLPNYAWQEFIKPSHCFKSKYIDCVFIAVAMISLAKLMQCMSVRQLKTLTTYFTTRPIYYVWGHIFWFIRYTFQFVCLRSNNVDNTGSCLINKVKQSICVSMAYISYPWEHSGVLASRALLPGYTGHRTLLLYNETDESLYFVAGSWN